MSSPKAIPYVLILTAGIIWGSTFSLVLIATADGTHPLALTTWQVILTAIMFVLVCVIGRSAVFRMRHLHYYTLIALIGIILPDLLYYSAAPHLSAGILAITVSTVPLFTYVLMWAMRYEPLVLKRVLGILLGMVAILLLVLPEHNLNSGDASFWILLVLLCAVSYAIENVYISEGIDDRVDIRELLCGSNIVASVILLPITGWVGVGTSPAWLLSSGGLALIVIAVSSTIAYTLFFYTIKTSGPVFASQCAYVVTVSGVVWGIVILAEVHTHWVWISVLVMVIGLLLVTPARQGPATVSTALAGEAP